MLKKGHYHVRLALSEIQDAPQRRPLLYQEERELEQSLGQGLAKEHSSCFLQACFLSESEVGVKIGSVPMY